MYLYHYSIKKKEKITPHTKGLHYQNNKHAKFYSKIHQYLYGSKNLMSMS